MFGAGNIPLTYAKTNKTNQNKKKQTNQNKIMYTIPACTWPPVNEHYYLTYLFSTQIKFLLVQIIFLFQLLTPKYAENYKRINLSSTLTICYLPQFNDARPDHVQV